MKSNLMSSVACAAGLLICCTSHAQPGGMRAPMVPQAIDTHMQQKRTLEQREAIEAKAAVAEPASQPAAAKKPAVKKAKKKAQRPAAGS